MENPRLNPRPFFVSVTALVLAMPVPAACASEAAYPSKPIRFIVPFGPSGGGDTVARLLGQKLGPFLSTTVMIDNRPGAGATLGTALAAKSAPDGYTILLGNVGPLAIAGSLYKDVPYDPVKDFAAISMLVTYPNVLVVHPSVPARSVKQLVALAKARPGTLSFASSGSGSSTHLAGELLKSMAGIQMIHVPYKTASQAVVDLIAGQTTLYFSSVVGALPHAKAGKLRALGLTGRQRMPIMPDVPTIAESGFPDYEAVNWLGVLAPKGTPESVIARLHGAITAAMRQADIEEKLAAQGAQVTVGSPESFSAYIAAETRKWSKVVKDSGARAD
jgi:tripartite-type tricarboxylate transporter receptor subunit TctC